MKENFNIYDAASKDQKFSTFAKALQAAGLAETLKGGGPFTLFAPTNEAFAKLPKSTMDELLKPGEQGAPDEGVAISRCPRQAPRQGL